MPIFPAQSIRLESSMVPGKRVSFLSIPETGISQTMAPLQYCIQTVENRKETFIDDFSAFNQVYSIHEPFKEALFHESSFIFELLSQTSYYYSFLWAKIACTVDVGASKRRNLLELWWMQVDLWKASHRNIMRWLAEKKIVWHNFLSTWLRKNSFQDSSERIKS